MQGLFSLTANDYRAAESTVYFRLYNRIGEGIMIIGSLLRYWRENKNLTYYRMAQDSGIDADYIKKIEESTEDNEPNIKIETLERLAKALGVPASDLINNNEDIMYLTEKELELITVFRRFSGQEQDAFINVMDLVSNKH